MNGKGILVLCRCGLELIVAFQRSKGEKSGEMAWNEELRAGTSFIRSQSSCTGGDEKSGMMIDERGKLYSCDLWLTGATRYAAACSVPFCACLT
jgi:hypothetical protein